MSLVGCGSAESTETLDPGPTYYQDVKPILDGRCVGCHTEGNIGPFALDTYENARKARSLIVEKTADRTMPPWSADPGHRAYKFDPSLTEDQIQLLRKWVEMGAKEGDSNKPGASLPSVDQHLSRVDRTLKMPVAYVPTQAPDEYRCFILDWSDTETVYVTGFTARPGDARIDHHIAAFLVRPDNPLGESVFDSLAQLDSEDPEPGYKCFGGPGGESGLQIPAQQIGSWVPGSGGGTFRPGVESKSHLGQKWSFKCTIPSPGRTTFQTSRPWT